MAYADKSCDMRRVCVAKGGHVQFEGVEFGDFDMILRNRNGYGQLSGITTITTEHLKEKIKEYNESKMKSEEPMVLLYQDDPLFCDSDWDIKKDYVERNDAVYTTDETEAKK